MYFLRNLVQTIECTSEPDKALSAIVGKLKELQIEIEKYDAKKGLVVARCLTLAMNMVVWRCWSDKLVFQVRKLNAKRAKIEIFAIPNLLRTKIRQHETVVDVKGLISRVCT